MHEVMQDFYRQTAWQLLGDLVKRGCHFMAVGPMYVP